MAKVNDWKFFEQNVQSGMLEGRFMSAAYTMIAAGPPRLAAVANTSGVGNNGDDQELGDIAYPIGIIQSFNLGINSQWMRLWEIGSERSYFVRGRTQGQIGLGRIMYHGPNLLRVLYAYLDGSSNESFKFERLYKNQANALLNTSGKPNSKKRYVVPPGSDNLWLELAADIFTQPIGLLLYLRDSNEDVVGAFFIEYCNVANYGFTTDAGGTILSEQASLLYERIVPVKIEVVDLIKDSSSLAGIIGEPVIGSAAGPGTVQEP